jgi:hypothetical protein
MLHIYCSFNYTGMVHVQREGLQSHALHGIFHTPVIHDGEKERVVNPREGYRVAITARITHDDSERRVEPFLKDDYYSCVLGPNGDKTLKMEMLSREASGERGGRHKVCTSKIERCPYALLG